MSENRECPACSVCGRLITQPKRGPKRSKFCSKNCYLYDKSTSPHYKEYKKNYDKEYRRKNKDKIKRTKRRYHSSDMGRYNSFLSKLSNRFGIGETLYREIMDSQRGCCVICQCSLDEPCIDHNHKTGKVRGLLCSLCNSGLGYFKDNPSLLYYALEYLKDEGHYGYD